MENKRADQKNSVEFRIGKRKFVYSSDFADDLATVKRLRDDIQGPEPVTLLCAATSFSRVYKFWEAQRRGGDALAELVRNMNTRLLADVINTASYLDARKLLDSVNQEVAALYKSDRERFAALFQKPKRARRK